MKLPRRTLLRLTAGAAALPAVPRFARAQTYPARPVRLLVGFTAGTNIDIVARLFGHWLSEQLGQPFIIENRPGASGNLAAEAVVRAPADGHTLLMVSTAHSSLNIPRSGARSSARPISSQIDRSNHVAERQLVRRPHTWHVRT